MPQTDLINFNLLFLMGLLIILFFTFVVKSYTYGVSKDICFRNFILKQHLFIISFYKHDFKSVITNYLKFINRLCK
jgi:hypothetical protein